MARATLTGTRIRERRAVLGIRQTDLARQVGISASYLNLIEHNRRRIGGKLLLSIAAALEVEPAALSEGAEAALLAALREAAADRPAAGAELERIEEFAGRFPGWAQLLAAEYRRASALEQSVEALSDRLTHDPHLAASLHEVLSTVTAIHAAAEILVAERDLEPEWRSRFHRNINEDSLRLAEGARQLVAELDGGQRRETSAASPQEEVEAFLEAHGYHFAALEAGDGVAAVVGQDPRLTTAGARAIAERLLARYAADAARLPVPAVARGIAPGVPPDPVALAAAFGTDPGQMMRRLATLPPAVWADKGLTPPGLVIADASGTLVFRKPLDRFPLPRFGAACPLWPLFQALSQPMMAREQVVRVAGRTEGVFLTHSVALPSGPPVVNRVPAFEAHMMIQPVATHPDTADLPRVGVTCRICPKRDCRGRREPSIMSDGF